MAAALPDVMWPPVWHQHRCRHGTLAAFIMVACTDVCASPANASDDTQMASPYWPHAPASINVGAEAPRAGHIGAACGAYRRRVRGI